MGIDAHLSGRPGLELGMAGLRVLPDGGPAAGEGLGAVVPLGVAGEAVRLLAEPAE